MLSTSLKKRGKEMLDAEVVSILALVRSCPLSVSVQSVLIFFSLMRG